MGFAKWHINLIANGRRTTILNPAEWRDSEPLIRYFVVVFFILFSGCRAQQVIVSGTFTNPQKTYKVILPNEGWTYLRQGIGEDLALWNSGAGAGLAVIPHRQERGNLPLDVLQTHLFIGIKHRRILSKQYVTLSEQRALHTILIGEVNSSEIKISSYVLARDGWVYDLVYWAQSDQFDSALDDFERLVASFAFIK